MARYCVGIDLGGSFIKVGLLREDRKALKPIDLPTPQQGARSVADQMAAGARKVMEVHGVSVNEVVGVGIGSPGPLRMSEGVIIATPNIPGMANVPIRDMISKSLGLPAVLENDANAAGYGEFICSGEEGLRDLVFLTLGTGVGGGVVIDGRVLHGAHEIGAELGHMLVAPGGELCNCGQRGCLERYSSATFLSLRAQRMVEEGKPSRLKEVLRKKGKLDSKDINETRKAGDELAAKVWDEAAYYLGVACVNISRILDPDEIVLGGGLANAGDDILLPVRKHFAAMHWKITEPLGRVELARLGNDAGFIGAAGVAWLAFGNK
ncbi:MAG: ROK family protein [Phycisphaerae bacterium]